MNLLITWMALLITVAIATFISGITVGLVARSRHWSEERIRSTAFHGTFLLFILAALIQNRMHVHYASHLLAELGYPVIAPVSFCLLVMLFARLSGRIAWRISDQPKSDLA